MVEILLPISISSFFTENDDQRKACGQSHPWWNVTVITVRSNKRHDISCHQQPDSLFSSFLGWKHSKKFYWQFGILLDPCSHNKRYIKDPFTGLCEGKSIGILWNNLTRGQQWRTPFHDDVILWKQHQNTLTFCLSSPKFPNKRLGFGPGIPIFSNSDWRWRRSLKGEVRIRIISYPSNI